MMLSRTMFLVSAAMPCSASVARYRPSNIDHIDSQVEGRMIQSLGERLSDSEIHYVSYPGGIFDDISIITPCQAGSFRGCDVKCFFDVERGDLGEEYYVQWSKFIQILWGESYKEYHIVKLMYGDLSSRIICLQGFEMGTNAEVKIYLRFSRYHDPVKKMNKIIRWARHLNLKHALNRVVTQLKEEYYGRECQPPAPLEGSADLPEPSAPAAPDLPTANEPYNPHRPEYCHVMYPAYNPHQRREDEDTQGATGPNTPGRTQVDQGRWHHLSEKAEPHDCHEKSESPKSGTPKGGFRTMIGNAANALRELLRRRRPN